MIASLTKKNNNKKIKITLLIIKYNLLYYSSGQKIKIILKNVHLSFLQLQSHIASFNIYFYSLNHSILPHCSRKQLWKQSEIESKHIFSQLVPFTK